MRTRWLAEVWREVRWTCSAAAAWVGRHRFATLCALIALAGLAVGCWPRDPAWSEWLREHVSPPVRIWAGRLRVWGAFNDTLVFTMVLYMAGVVRRRLAWRAAALAALLASVTAGIAVNVLRVGLGRPRPRAELPNRFTGPSLEWKRQSFPSGHSGASWACASALVVTVPAYGTVAVISASAVAVASMLNRSHFPSDVLVGSGMGMWIGLAFGMAARRRARLGPPAQ